MFRYVFKAVLLVEIGIRAPQMALKLIRSYLLKNPGKSWGYQIWGQKTADKRGPRITEARIIEV